MAFKVICIVEYQVNSKGMHRKTGNKYIKMLIVIIYSMSDLISI